VQPVLADDVEQGAVLGPYESASSSGLTGSSLPGRPGFVVVPACSITPSIA